MKSRHPKKSPQRRRLVTSRLAVVVLGAACMCAFGFGWSAGASPRSEPGLPEDINSDGSGSTLALDAAPVGTATSPSTPPGRRVLMASESSRSWTGGLSPPRSPVRGPDFSTKGRLQLEARSLRKAPASLDQGNGGIEPGVHPAIHPPQDEPIRVDGPLFNRSGRTLRKSIEVSSDGRSRERSMRMHPAGKANLHERVIRSREGASAPHDGHASWGREDPDLSGSEARESVGHSSDGSVSRERAALPSDGFLSSEGADPSGSPETMNHRKDRPQENAARRAGRSHTVRSGESLWSIAAQALRTDDVRRVARYWPRIHRHNRAVVGRDPSLIFPGQILHLPPESND